MRLLTAPTTTSGRLVVRSLSMMAPCRAAPAAASTAAAPATPTHVRCPHAHHLGRQCSGTHRQPHTLSRLARCRALPPAAAQAGTGWHDHTAPGRLFVAGHALLCSGQRGASGLGWQQQQQSLARLSTCAATATGSGSDSDGDALASTFGSCEDDGGETLAQALNSYRIDNKLPWKEKAAWRMQPDEAEYWREHLGRLQKSVPKQMAAQLDLRYRLGVSGTFSADGTRGSLKQQPPGWEYFQKAKLKHPFAISLVKVGKFYESVGSDAVLLMEVANLNPMGNELRAGTPATNLDVLLKQLVDAGFSVSVWEEAGEAKEHGSRSAPKLRWNTQLVTPENPDYFFNYAESSSDRDFNPPTLIGVSCSASGTRVMVLKPTNRTICVYEGLSEDGVWGVVMADSSVAPVVWQHRPPDMPRHKLVGAASALHKETMDLEKRFGSQSIRWRSYRHADALAGFREKVCQAKGWPANTELPAVPAYEGAAFHGVRPLYFSTASQLGLLSTRGIPKLMDSCVSDAAPMAVRDALAGLLVSPPPHDVAAGIRRALRRLETHDEVMPLYLASGVTTPKKITAVLDSPGGNESFFQGLLGMLQPVVASLHEDRSPGLAVLIEDVWPLLQHVLGAPHLTQQQVLAAASDAISSIQEVVFEQSAAAAVSSSSVEGPFEAAANNAVELLSDRMELWRCKVKPEALGDVASKACDAYDDLVIVCEALLAAATQAATAGAAGLKPRDKPCLNVDANNESVWLKLSEAARRALHGQALHLHIPDFINSPGQVLRKPFDRNGARLKGECNFTCDELDARLTSYRVTVKAANTAAVRALKGLTKQLSAKREELAAASQLGILLAALLDHSATARTAGWTLPLVGAAEQQEGAAPGSSSSSSSSSGAFSVQGLWPYWMAGSQPSTVRNDVTLQGMMLLTGPNMAGKSTVLRSLAAAALLGSAGLAIPAAAGSQLPLLDAVMLRTFSGDAPQEGLSAYGVEMREMGFVLSDVRASSLVLVDELGKGTEVISGTSLASGILRQLAAAGASGVFATHLHLLVDLLAHVPRLTPYRMEVVEDETAAASTSSAPSSSSSSSSRGSSGFYHLRPTWRIQPGHCFESLAFAVAAQQGLPPAVLAAAEADYCAIVHDMGGYQALTQVLRRDKGGSSSNGSSSSINNNGGSSNGASNSGSGDGSGSNGISGHHQLQELSHSAATATSSSSSSSGSSDAASEELMEAGRRRSRRYRSSMDDDSGGRDAPGGAASFHWALSGNQWLQPHSADRARLLQLLEAAYHFDASQVSGRPAAASAATDLGSKQAASAALDSQEGSGSSAESASRRRRRQTGQPDEQQSEQAGELSAAAQGSSGVECGVVHELLGSAQPPPAHAGRSAVYALLFDDGWWYVGETQNMAARRGAHRVRRGRKQEVAVWYILLPASKERKVVQGQVITSLQGAGFNLLSSHDAAMAYRK